MEVPLIELACSYGVRIVINMSRALIKFYPKKDSVSNYQGRLFTRCICPIGGSNRRGGNSINFNNLKPLYSKF